MSLTKKVTRNSTRAKELEAALKRQFNMLHSINHFDDYEIESLLLRQQQREVDLMKNRFIVPNDYPKFSPSGADKCKRELFYKILRVKQDETPQHPYHSRWTKNATAIHGARQRDLLYSEKLLFSPSFTVERMADGLPAWEKNVQAYRFFEHNGQKFYLFGMMDGILSYKDGSRIGFEYKTKSTKPDSIEKMKSPAPSHKKQTVAYSLLFSDEEKGPIDEFLITYESLSKDEWRSGAAAMNDIKPFYYMVSEADRIKLLDKFAEVAAMIETGEVPDQETSKCMFCPYKSTCYGGEQ